jgi:Tol biopolymer transport system component
MIEGVFRLSTSIPTASAISDSGTLIYVPGISPPTTSHTDIVNLVWVDQQGNVEEIATDPEDYDNPSLSPDGTKVAVTVNTEDGASDIHILDLNGKTQTRLTFNKNSTDPLWTTNGQRVVFLAGEGDERGIYWKAADGRGNKELLALVSDGGGPPWSWADDGKTLVTTKLPSGVRLGLPPGVMRGMMRGGIRGRGSEPPRRAQNSEGSSTSEETGISTDIGTISMEGDHEWQQLLHLSGGIVTALQISPDGKWMAYSIRVFEPGQGGVFVRPFSDVEEGGRWQVRGEASGCLWSPSGQELFYSNIEDGSLMAIEVETDPTFQFGKSKVLFNPGDIGLSRWIIQTGSIISPVDKRFLMTKPADTADDESQVEESPFETPRKIIFVVNWDEELKERVHVE